MPPAGAHAASRHWLASAPCAWCHWLASALAGTCQCLSPLSPKTGCCPFVVAQTGRAIHARHERMEEHGQARGTCTERERRQTRRVNSATFHRHLRSVESQGGCLGGFTLNPALRAVECGRGKWVLATHRNGPPRCNRSVGQSAVENSVGNPEAEMPTTAKVAIAASWVILTSIGCAMAPTSVACGAVAVLITALHLVGYQLYKHQGPHGYCPSVAIAPAYHPSIIVVAVEQLVFFFLALVLLDGGVTALLILISAAAYWMTLVVIAVRRSAAPTTTDILWLRYGFLLLFLITAGSLTTWASFRRG